MPNYNPEDEAIYQQQQEEILAAMIEKAANAVMKGENADQVLEIMLASASGTQKQVIKERFIAALRKRKLREPTGEADVPSRSTLMRLRTMLATSAQMAMEHILQLVKARPDLAERIKQAGTVLASNGVKLVDNNVREEELGSINPTPLAVAQTRKTSMGGVGQ